MSCFVCCSLDSFFFSSFSPAFWREKTNKQTHTARFVLHTDVSRVYQQQPSESSFPTMAWDDCILKRIFILDKMSMSCLLALLEIYSWRWGERRGGKSSISLLLTSIDDKLFFYCCDLDVMLTFVSADSDVNCVNLWVDAEILNAESTQTWKNRKMYLLISL